MKITFYTQLSEKIDEIIHKIQNSKSDEVKMSLKSELQDFKIKLKKIIS